MFSTCTGAVQRCQKTVNEMAGSGTNAPIVHVDTEAYRKTVNEKDDLEEAIALRRKCIILDSETNEVIDTVMKKIKERDMLAELTASRSAADIHAVYQKQLEHLVQAIGDCKSTLTQIGEEAEQIAIRWSTLKPSDNDHYKGVDPSEQRQPVSTLMRTVINKCAKWISIILSDGRLEVRDLEPSRDVVVVRPESTETKDPGSASNRPTSSIPSIIPTGGGDFDDEKNVLVDESAFQDPPAFDQNTSSLGSVRQYLMQNVPKGLKLGLSEQSWPPLGPKQSIAHSNIQHLIHWIYTSKTPIFQLNFNNLNLSGATARSGDIVLVEDVKVQRSFTNRLKAGYIEVCTPWVDYKSLSNAMKIQSSCPLVEAPSEDAKFCGILLGTFFVVFKTTKDDDTAIFDRTSSPVYFKPNLIYTLRFITPKCKGLSLQLSPTEKYEYNLFTFPRPAGTGTYCSSIAETEPARETLADQQRECGSENSFNSDM